MTPHLPRLHRLRPRLRNRGDSMAKGNTAQVQAAILAGSQGADHLGRDQTHRGVCRQQYIDYFGKIIT